MKKENDILLQVSRLHRLAVKALGRGLKEINMTHGLAAALLHLEHIGDGCTIKLLANSLEVESPTLVVILQRLEQMKLIEKRPKPGNKRKTQIYFTPAGIKVLESINEIYTTTCDSLLKGISITSLKQTTALLENVYSSMVIHHIEPCSIATQEQR